MENNNEIKEEVKQTQETTEVTDESTLNDVEETIEEVTIEVKKKKEKNKYKDLSETQAIEIAELKNELLKNRADFENFKKRLKDEQIKDRKYASVNLITDLVTPLEFLTKACSMQTEDANMKNFLIGFKMISDQLTEVLKQDGLVVLDALNLEFDPSVHHAVEKVSVDGVKSNIVVEELSKTYKYKDRIIKPAMVKVSE